ncbi:hypothetical protein AVEN_55338-1 [Araneus ventricosus]|uniref:Uncharacterized protein n=1 Tax=Araneus ventricosus TaxID=182803 RepID=A0A4Y2DC38_ARAVE|nr:hypothetical protein AVEN_55338-1 [Araneus ventricosus]
MAASDEDSRIIVPFIPTLFHMSLAMVAVRFYNEFGLETLKKAFLEMESRNGPNLRSRVRPNLRSRIRETLLFIPPILRRRLPAAVERVESEISHWIYHHQYVDRFDHEKCTFFWKSDGTIDRIKTAQEISRNRNVDIRARFEIACMYCLANEVQVLWAAMQANRETKKYERSVTVSAMVRFWIRWAREGAKVSWIQAAQEYLNHQVPQRLTLYPVFRELMPEERRNFFCHLHGCNADDLRFCLYTVTKDEQEEIMKAWGAKVLEIHMNWPLAGGFLGIAKKAWKFLDGFHFCILLVSLLDRKDRTDCDFGYLADEFWNRSPCRFKEYAKEFGLSDLFTRGQIP